MTIKHKWQQTGFTCGAAAVAMILGIGEKEARHLAGTTKKGTPLSGAARALESSGKPVYTIRCEHRLSDIGWQLESQSMRWPLWIHLSFPMKYQGKKKVVTHKREHAVVLYKGQLFDPGEVETLSVETLGHLSDGEPTVRGYVLLEADYAA
jgi:hypothetical protein